MFHFVDRFEDQGGEKCFAVSPGARRRLSSSAIGGVLACRRTSKISYRHTDRQTDIQTYRQTPRGSISVDESINIENICTHSSIVSWILYSLDYCTLYLLSYFIDCASHCSSQTSAVSPILSMSSSSLAIDMACFTFSSNMRLQGGARLIRAMNPKFGNGRAIISVVTMTNCQPLTRYYDIQ
jgi:hypothetical protein